MAITAAQRKKSETLIYAVMDAVDPSGKNSEHYKKKFNGMTNDQFEQMFKNKYPLVFHIEPFELEPTLEDIERGANLLGVPLLEKVRLPHIHKDKEGTAILSQECLVGYIPIRRVQQFVTKKNAMSTDISQRDMKTGLLINFDRNGKTSDREAEALIALGLDKTVSEFIGPRADSILSKNTMYSTISTLGNVSQRDLPVDPNDSLAMNLFNVYMVGAHIQSNLLNSDYLLPYTVKKHS